MTDLETIRSMLTRAKIPFDETPDEDNGQRYISVNRGYEGFVASFTFDDAGNLQDLGAYE